MKSILLAVSALTCLSSSALAQDAPHLPGVETALSSAPPNSEASETPATVVIIRAHGLALLLRRATFFIDGNDVATLGDNRCFRTQVRPGTHTIEQRWPFDLRMRSVGQKLKTNFLAQSGQSSYFLFSTSADVSYGMIELKSGFGQVGPELGANFESKCKFANGSEETTAP